MLLLTAIPSHKMQRLRIAILLALSIGGILIHKKRAAKQRWETLTSTPPHDRNPEEASVFVAGIIKGLVEKNNPQAYIPHKENYETSLPHAIRIRAVEHNETGIVLTRKGEEYYVKWKLRDHGDILAHQWPLDSVPKKGFLV